MLEELLARMQLPRLLGTGMDHLEAAYDMVSTPKTMEKHTEHILMTLGVHSRAQSIALAFQTDEDQAPQVVELRRLSDELRRA